MQNCPAADVFLITPPSSTGERNMYQCDIEYRGQLYSLTWAGSQQYPDLSGFPTLQTGKLVPVKQSPEIFDLKKQPTFLTAGAHASVRRLASPTFSIAKLAHPDHLSMALIQREYEIISQLSQLALSVPAISQEPILENGRIRGFRMEELHNIGYDEMQNLTMAVEEEVARFHQAGYAHGDLSPSNVMKNSHGRVVLIDVSFSGRLDDQIPPRFPAWVYQGSTFEKDSDLERLKKYWA